MIEERPYCTVEDRHGAGLSGGNSASSRETVIMVREPEPDIKTGDVVMHQVGRKKVPVMVREVLSVDQMHKSKLFKIFFRYLTREEEKIMEKTCPQCGRTFITTDGRQKYCSVKCRVAAADEKRLKKEQEEKEVNENTVAEPAAEIPETPENPITPEPLAAEPAPEPSVIGKSYGDYSKEFPDYFRPDSKNIRAAKKILELVPQGSDYTLKISLRSDDILLDVTLYGAEKGNAD